GQPGGERQGRLRVALQLDVRRQPRAALKKLERLANADAAALAAARARLSAAERALTEHGTE
ncbi:hypothetical protein KZ866_02025, partial [Pseudomonas aeruginosa]